MISNSTRIICKRALSTAERSHLKNDIGKIFIQDNIQRLLKEITRYDEQKVFAKRRVKSLKSPKFIFMTDKQLEQAKEDAYENVKARLQMPPVMAPDLSEPEILACDKEIVGYTKFKIMFIDIGPGHSARNRLMSVREPDGTLRYPTHAERSRLNHIFYPDDTKSIDEPKLFQEQNLSRLLKRQEYTYILGRACAQFEPDDPRYTSVTEIVYNYIDDQGDFDKLRSTRFFGPMSLHLAYNKRADNLIQEMLSKNLVEDAVKLIEIYNTCHNIKFNKEDSDICILKSYAEDSPKKFNLDLAIQDVETRRAGKRTAEEDSSEQK